MTAWLVVVAAGAGSYLLRVSMLVLASRGGLPPVVERAAGFAVPVSFAALAATALTAHSRAAEVPIAPVAVAAVAVVAVRRTGSPHAAIVAGMPAVWVLGALGAL